MEENVQAVKQQEVDKIGLIQRFKNWYNDKPIWQTAVPGFALASLAVILVVNQSDVPHQNISPDSSITMASADNDGLIESIKQYPSPWENQTLGFSSSTYSTPVKAVGIGIWRSKSKLINSKDPLPVQLESEVAIDWKTSEWRDYYAFGEWIINAWELANEEQVGLSKWVELSKTLQTLESNFKQHPKPEPEAEITLQAIDKIKVSLGLLSQKKDTLAQTTLLREMDLGLQKLFF
ncbi:MAG: hypothetical protein KAG86_11025 [Gammaproteobacteria bacterium]|nr:hypothetical protein [Gammaproteobacteria bacterium]